MRLVGLARGRWPFADRFGVDRRRADLAWTLGVAAYCAVIVAFFPSVRDSAAFAAALDDYPEPVRELLGDAALDLTSAPGFFHAEVFSIVGPLLLSIVTIGVGASLAADERAGVLDLVLANDVTRRRYAGERMLAMVVAVSRPAVAMYVTLALAGPLIDSEIGLMELASAVVGCVVFALVVGVVALTVASWTGDRSASIGSAVAVFTLAYVVSAGAELVDAIAPLRSASPYYWLVARSALFGEASATGVVFWLVLIAAAAGVAGDRLERRDLS